MKTRVSYLFRFFTIEMIAITIIAWVLIIFGIMYYNLDTITNIKDFFRLLYITYIDDDDLLFLIFLFTFSSSYPFYYKSTIEVTATEDCLVCSRNGKILYKLYYSEIKDYRKFTYGNLSTRVTALFVATEKCKRPCSILGVTAHRFKNRKCQLYFECVNEVSEEMAEYVIDKIEEHME